MSEGAIEPVPAGTGTQDVPLKQRFYYYRGKVLRFRRRGSDADEMYWALRNSAPVLTSLDPNTAQHVASAFTLTITGSGFEMGSIIHFGTQTAPAAIVNVTTVILDVPSGYHQTAGVYQVSVESPRGAMSNSLPFTFT